MKIELREKEVVISGYVNAICRDSRVMTLPDGTRFVEQVKEGVFSKAINTNKDIKLKFNHGKVIGGTTDSSLEVREDNIGLYAVAKVTDQEVIEAADEGRITGWSFGFNVIEDEIQLNEISILSDRVPAYAGTSYELREEGLSALETRGLHEENVEKIIFRTPKPSYDAEKIKRMRLDIKKMEV